jgi:hypothetical protein
LLPESQTQGIQEPEIHDDSLALQVSTTEPAFEVIATATVVPVVNPTVLLLPQAPHAEPAGKGSNAASPSPVVKNPVAPTPTPGTMLPPLVPRYVAMFHEENPYLVSIRLF